MSSQTKTVTALSDQAAQVLFAPVRVPLLRLWWASSGRAAVARVTPLYVGLMVLGGVLFGGNGMDARDLTGLAARQVGVRVGVLGIWVLLATPGVRALVGARSALGMRALPVRRSWHYALTGLGLAVLELPLVGLWLRGAGLLAGLSLLLWLLAVHALLAQGPLRWIERGLMLVLWGLWTALPQHVVGAAVHGAVGTLVLWQALPRAWRLAAERPRPLEKPHVFGGTLRALTTSYLVLLQRTQRPLLVRAALLLAVALAIATLATRNNHLVLPAEVATRSLLVLGPLVLLAAGGLAGAVLQSERTLLWLLESTGCSGFARVWSSQAAVVLPIAVLSTVYGAVLGALLQVGPALRGRLVLEAVLCGVWAAQVAMALLRWSSRGEEHDSDRILKVQLMAGAVAITATWALHEGVLLSWALAAVLLSGIAVSWAAPLTRYLRLRWQQQLAAHPEEV